MVAQPCIYVCGAEGTGKTDWTGRIARNYKLPMLPETARIELDCRGGSFGPLLCNPAAMNDYQRAVFDRQIALELATTPAYVADGHCLENLAYASENAQCVAELNQRLIGDTSAILRCGCHVAATGDGKLPLCDEAIRVSTGNQLQAHLDKQKQLRCREYEILTRLRNGVVFFLRPHPSMNAQDGIRIGADYVAKQRIDAKLELLMQLWRVQYVSIETPNAARREELIDYVLAAKGFKKCPSIS